MAWFDNLRDASFRDVAFYYDGTLDPIGRNGVVHTYPKRDDVYVEDMGLFNAEIRIRAYVATDPESDDYYPARDALIEALNKPGTGTLVHPYFGEIEVFALPGSQEQAYDSGGVAYFDLRFFPSRNTADNPTNEQSTPEFIMEWADETLIDAVEEMADDWSIEDVSDWVTDDMLGVLTDFAETITNFVEEIPLLPDVLDVVDSAYRAISQIITSGERLVLSPLAYGGRIVGLLTNMGAAFSPPRRMAFFNSLYDAADNFGVRSVPYATPSATAANGNAAAFRKIVKQTAAAEAARSITGGIAYRNIRSGKNVNDEIKNAASAAVNSGGTSIIVLRDNTSAIYDPTASEISDLTSGIFSDIGLIVVNEDSEAQDAIIFTSKDEAIAARDVILGNIDQILPDASSKTFRSLLSLRSALIKDIRIRAANLPSVVRYIPNETMPSLAIAWDLYADAERNEEIGERNNAPHAGFLIGGDSLEVLSE